MNRSAQRAECPGRPRRGLLNAAALAVAILGLAIHCGGGGGSTPQGGAPPLPAGSAQVPCPATTQEHSEWCWAASSSCLLTQLGTPETQCEVVNYVRGISYACGNSTFAWQDTQANSPIQYLYGPAPSVSDLMSHFGHPCTGSSAALTFTQIQTEINAKRPFFVNWAWSSGGGHILLGIGWDTTTGTEELVLMDPWPNEGLKTVSYAWAVAGTDATEDPDPHSWQWSLTLNP